MPRPLSETVILLSSCTVTLISVQAPARCSSMALSTISQMRCMRPSWPVPPMYIPGRMRTASKSSKTLICSAPYSFTVATELVLWAFSTKVSHPWCTIIPN